MFIATSVEHSKMGSHRGEIPTFVATRQQNNINLCHSVEQGPKLWCNTSNFLNGGWPGDPTGALCLTLEKEMTMKKTLVALAAFAAVGAYAQSNVTLYGIVEPTIDLGYSKKMNATTVGTTAANVTTTTAVSSKNNPGIRVQDGGSQGQGASRLGFKGAEDLGGGMKANFQLEAAIATDSGATGGNSGTGNTSATAAPLTFARQAWAGVSGGFGEVRVGRQYTPSYFVQERSMSAANSNGVRG